MPQREHPRIAGDWIDSFMLMTENTEPPTLYRKWAAVSAVASALQRKCWLPWGRYTFYPNLYVVLIAPPGKARKGTAMSEMIELIERPEMKIAFAAESGTREALIEALAEAAIPMQYNDPEAGTRVVVNSSITVLNTELTVFLGQNKSEMLDTLTDWYDCKRRWRYRTRSRNVEEIDGVWVNIFGATTPTALRTSLPPEAIGGGLTSRIIFVFAEKRAKKVALPFPTGAEAELKARLARDLEAIVLLEGFFDFTMEFAATYKIWYEAQPDDNIFADDRLAGYYERRPEKLLKLSMIMSASRGSSMRLDVEDFERARELLEETEVDMPIALTGVGRVDYEEMMPRVQAYIAIKREVTISQLQRKFLNQVRYDDLMLMIKALHVSGFCQHIENGGPNGTGSVRLCPDAESSV